MAKTRTPGITVLPDGTDSSTNAISEFGSASRRRHHSGTSRGATPDGALIGSLDLENQWRAAVWVACLRMNMQASKQDLQRSASRTLA